MTQPIDPTLFNPPSDQSVPFDQFTATYDDAISNADKQVEDAKTRYTTAQAAVSAIDPNKLTSQDALKAAQDELAKAATVVENASAQAARARELKGAAVERYSQRGNIPQELRDRYAAMAQVERANAAKAKAETDEFLNTATDRRAQVQAATKEATANAAVAQAKADLANATTDIQKQSAQTAYDQAVANLGRTQIDNQTAGYQSQITAAQAAVAPEVSRAAATKATGEAAITTAQAAVAPQAAQAAVDQAQANVNKTNQEITDLQRQARQAPTDAQAQQAIQTQIQQKQVELSTAQQQLDAAKQLLPINVAQGQANVAATQAGTQKGILGNLYGLQERVKAIADALRSGQITDPAEAQQQLQDYIRTTIAGTTPYEAQTTALNAETARRQQDYSLASTQTSTFGSGFGTALGQFGKLNDTTPVGSDVAGRGFLASMNLLQNGIRNFQPSVPMNSPLLASMANMGMTPSVGATALATAQAANPMPAVAAPAAAPTTTIAPDGTVTIAHTPSSPTTTTPTAAGLLPPGAAGTSADPTVAGSPALLNAGDPALPHHVENLWAGDPNLNPDIGRAAAVGLGVNPGGQ